MSLICCRRGLVWSLIAILAFLTGLYVAAPAAAQSSTICVALVVDFGDLGGGVHTSCATVRRGATGYDVLRAGGHTFTVCSNGVLGSIDGKPADGCTEKNDSQHFWSYWHRAPGSSTWNYSNEGAGTYTPRESSTEGWHWMKSPPPDVPYPAGCHTPPPSTSPSPSPSRVPTTTPTPTHHVSPATTYTPTTSTRVAVSSRRHRSAVRPAATATGAPTISRTPVAAAPRKPSDGARRGSGPVVILGICLAAALGAGAWWHTKRPS